VKGKVEKAWWRLTVRGADLAAPVLDSKDRLVGDQCLLRNDEAPFAVVRAAARDLYDRGVYCKGQLGVSELTGAVSRGEGAVEKRPEGRVWVRSPGVASTYRLLVRSPGRRIRRGRSCA